MAQAGTDAGESRLGRGLGALLGESFDVEEAEDGGAQTLPVAAIAPNPFQPRREFAEEELEGLAASIRENGLLQPVVVRPAGADADVAWQLVAGERRWRAVMRLGWRELPALVREVDEHTLLVLALVENLQRSGLSALEEAKGYRQLADEFGLTQKQIAEAVGRDRSTVSNTLRLLRLPASVRKYVVSGELTAGHARALLGLDDGRRMARLARRAVDSGWSVREVERRVKEATQSTTEPEKTSAPEPRRDPTERRLEEELQRALGTDAKIRNSGGSKGRIEVPFHTAEDFERLYELIVGESVADVV